MATDHSLPHDVVGLIYERLAENEPWKQSLEHLRLMLDASNLMIRIGSKNAQMRDAIFAYGPKVDQVRLLDWEERIYREIFPVSPSRGQTAFFQWEQVLKKAADIRYMQEVDSSWSIIHCFDSTPDSEYFLIGSRGATQRPFDDRDAGILEDAGKHFRKAFELRREFLRYRLTAEFQGEGLDRMAIGAILVERSGSTIPLNHTARALIESGDGLCMRGGRICALDEHDDRRLQLAIRQVFSGKGTRLKARALTLANPHGRRDLGIVVQGRASVSLVSGKPDTNVMIFARDIDSSTELDFDLTKELFHFTPAESRLAAGLAKGRLLSELEADLNISHNTARAHLRSMFAKADVSRQSQLVYLLANCVAPLGKS